MERAEKIDKERGKAYGDFSEVAETAQLIKARYRSKDMHPAIRESLDLIATKMARIIHGDPNHEDSWVDIAGYANLAVKTLIDESFQ